MKLYEFILFIYQKCYIILIPFQKGDFSDTVELSGQIFDKIGFDRLHTLSCTAFPKKVSPHTGVDGWGAANTINR